MPLYNLHVKALAGFMFLGEPFNVILASNQKFRVASVLFVPSFYALLHTFFTIPIFNKVFPSHLTEPP